MDAPRIGAPCRLCFAKRSSARSDPRRWRRLATGLAMPARHRASSHDVRPVPEPPWRAAVRLPHPGRPRTREPRPAPAVGQPAAHLGPPSPTQERPAFWLVLSRLWSRWADVLVVVKPDTVVRWHRAGFRLFWRWKSRSRSLAESDVSAEVKTLIRQMAETNVGWGAPKVHGELLKLGIDISERSVSRFMPPKPRKPPSQTWRTFLDNHVGSLASIDFFTVPTATFRVLYVFFVLAHDRRRVLHFNVTEFPSAQWTGQQIIEAFPADTAPRYMIRDRDGIYAEQFRRRIEGIGIEEVLTAPQSPWQNPYAERLVGSVRRECLDHVIVLGQRHLHRILKSYFAYYHR